MTNLFSLYYEHLSIVTVLAISITISCFVTMFLAIKKNPSNVKYWFTVGLPFWVILLVWIDVSNLIKQQTQQFNAVWTFFPYVFLPLMFSALTMAYIREL